MDLAAIRKVDPTATKTADLAGAERRRGGTGDPWRV